MKILKRMLLIHWYYFEHEMIEFDMLNFLTGKNSSGKSTIIDAMQLVLLGDLSGSFFNKAAGSKGTRTLAGYLRCELGDDEASGFRYLRSGRFTSYIALEFYDDKKKNYFTSGCCFDVFGDNDEQKLFFRFDERIPEGEFLSDGVPWSIEQLRAYLRTHYAANHCYTTPVGRDFREDLCGRLGGLQTSRFCNLLKKAVGFNPNVNIQQFITEFVCGDEEKVNVTDMQENIRSYETLRQESEVLKARVALLSQICDTHDSFLKYEENEKLYGYLVDRAGAEIKAHELANARRDKDRFTARLEEIQRQLEAAEREEKQLKQERDTLKLQLASDENARRLEDLQREISEKKERCEQRRRQFESSSAGLAKMFSEWGKGLSNAALSIPEVDKPAIDPSLRERIDALSAEGKGVLAQVASAQKADIGSVLESDEQKLFALSKTVDAFRDSTLRLDASLGETLASIGRTRYELEREKTSLEKGIYAFPPDAVNLKEAITSRLRARFGPDTNAVIVAEAAEIRGDRWRNAVEGYLHTQKFYVIVAPEHFRCALQAYDAVKHEKKLYATGLVDTEKLQQVGPVADPGSLAEEIETENAAVRLFLDYTLGRVHKCDSIEALRRHRTSVTDEGVLYQNFVVRAMDPKRWKDPAIGSEGKRLRLAAICAELERLSGVNATFDALSRGLRHIANIPRLSESDITQLVAIAEEYRSRPALLETIRRLEDDAASIDRSEIAELQARLEARERLLTDAAEQIRKYARDCGAVEQKLLTCMTENIPALEEAYAGLTRELTERYPQVWCEETAAPRYEKELAARGVAEEIYKAFPREQSRAKNARETTWEQLREQRRKYNGVYMQGHDISKPDNEVYREELRVNAENKLPEYEAKIEDTRAKAMQQFQEDFLSKLQSNIFSARRQIDELNAAMRGAQFGEDHYRFRVSVNPEYKRFYDMIVDEMLLSGYTMFSDQYNMKYKEEIKELFDLITNDGGASGYAEHEKRVQLFTDYKTYLTFDLEVVKPNGDSERLSRTMGKKSGGETQTPFYVAVLASFAQLYRIGRDETQNTARLILFDEAFSKMDGERIVQSIALLRRFGFQAVLAAPPDKVADIAVLVDRNLCVLRDGKKTCVRPFDPRHFEESIETDEPA